MFANQLFGLVFLAAVMAVVSSEVFSALHGIHYAVKEGGGWRVALTRYQWASPLFHEVACSAAGREASYRASRVVGVFGAAAVLMGYAGADMYVAGGAAVLAACAFGAATYGKAFVAHRTVVRQEIEAWASAAA